MQPERRMDVLTAGEIDRAIEIDRAEGAIKAWIYLTQRGIPTETIQRILDIDSTPDAYRLPQAQPVGTSADRRRR